MVSALIIAQRVAVLLLLVALGVLVRRAGIMDTDLARRLSNFLLLVVNPLLIVKAYLRPYDAGELRCYAAAFVLSILAHGIWALLAPVFIRRREDTEYRQERLAAIYPNCGFMAIPLVTALQGETGIFYIIAFLSVQAVYLWSHGLYCLGGREQVRLRKMFVNPGVIGLLVGLLLYFTQLPLPFIVEETISDVASMNTPLAMVLTGVFLSELKLRELVTDLRAYRAAALRLLLFPALFIVLLRLSGFPEWFQGADQVYLAIAVVVACPTAAFSILFSARMKLSGAHSAKLVAVSTVLSVLTLPLLTYFAQILL